MSTSPNEAELLRRHAAELDSPYIQAFDNFQQASRDLNEFLMTIVGRNVSVDEIEHGLWVHVDSLQEQYGQIAQLVLATNLNDVEVAGELGHLWFENYNVRQGVMNWLITEPPKHDLCEPIDAKSWVLTAFASSPDDKATELVANFGTDTLEQLGKFLVGVDDMRASVEVTEE